MKTVDTPASLAPSAKVNAHIDGAPDFARPILTHLRLLVHQASPGVEESIKWSRPFFLHRGALLCHMAAFKQHCGFGFWGAEMAAILREDGYDPSEASGSFGRIASLNDLPSDKKLSRYIKQAVSLLEAAPSRSAPPPRRVRQPKPELTPPPDFQTALERRQGAAEAYANLSPGCRREYLQWIFEAKRPETREKRIHTSIEWMTEGKSLNWKYENC